MRMLGVSVLFMCAVCVVHGESDTCGGAVPWVHSERVHGQQGELRDDNRPGEVASATGIWMKGNGNGIANCNRNNNKNG